MTNPRRWIMIAAVAAAVGALAAAFLLRGRAPLAEWPLDRPAN